MTVLAGVASAIVVAAAVVAVTARDTRRALIALAVVLLIAPFAGALPSIVAVAARATASLLGLFLVWLAARDVPRGLRGSLAGLPAEAMAGLVGLVSGWAAAEGASDLLGGPAAAPSAVGASVALAVLAAGPLVSARDAFRLGIGLTLLTVAATLAWSGLAGATGAAEQLVAGGLALGALASQAVLVRSSVAEV